MDFSSSAKITTSSAQAKCDIGVPFRSREVDWLLSFRRIDRSRKYTLNKSGHSGCPCYVPLPIANDSLIRPLIFTTAKDDSYMDRIRLKKPPFILSKASLKSKACLLTVPNALRKSANTA